MIVKALVIVAAMLLLPILAELVVLFIRKKF